MGRQHLVDPLDDLCGLFCRIGLRCDRLRTCMEDIPEIIRVLASDIGQFVGELFQLRIDLGGHDCLLLLPRYRDLGEPDANAASQHIAVSGFARQ